MTRYQQGFNPFTGPVHLPSDDEFATMRSELVAGSKKLSPAKPFERQFDLWSTALKVAVLDDLDPDGVAGKKRSKFHDNVGSLIGGDLPLMALVAATAVRYEQTYGGRVFEDAIAVLDDARRQIHIADLYAHAGTLRLLEVIQKHHSAPGPAITRHFQKQVISRQDE